MNEIKKYKEVIFDSVKHVDEYGNEYWLARELQVVLDYKEWRKFENVISKAKNSCKNSDINVFDCFVDVDKSIISGKGRKSIIKDYKLNRYACYLIAQNGAGYKGLYGGETADDIAKRKGLRYREEILDNMGSTELIANLFRISQTEEKLKKDNVNTEKYANETHNKVGKIVRKAIKEADGTMPEDLPTPNKSLKELENEQKRQEIEMK